MSNSNEPRSVRLSRRWGQSTHSIIECIEAWCERTAPLIAWADPMPGSPGASGDWGRDPTFKPLMAGRPSWTGKPPLAEARLFWKDSALHLLADPEGGCRWALISEAEELDAPKDSSGADTIEVERADSTVLVLRDHERFGLPDGLFEDKHLVAVEYQVDGRLLAWRLERRG